MEEDLVGSADLSNLLDWLLNTNLVVDVDDGADQGVWADRLLEDLEVNEAIGLHWKVGDVKPFVLEFAARVEDALMVNLGSNDVLLLVSVERCDTLEAEIVRLGGSTGEDDFLLLSSDQARDMFSGVFTSLFGLPSEAVGTGVRVSETLSQVWEHLVKNSIY